MEFKQDFAALAQQVQALVAIVEELTKKNQEMRLRLQHEENQSRANQEDEGDSHRRSDCRGPTTLEEQNSNEFQKSKDEVEALEDEFHDLGDMFNFQTFLSIKCY